MKLEMLPVYPKTGSENEKINKKNFKPYIRGYEEDDEDKEK